MDGEKKPKTLKSPPFLAGAKVSTVEQPDGRIELAVLDEALDVYIIRSDITVVDERGLPARVRSSGKPRKRK